MTNENPIILLECIRSLPGWLCTGRSHPKDKNCNLKFSRW